MQKIYFSSTIIALLATWKAGASYVPMEPSFPQGRITHILKDAQPSLIIYDDTGKSFIHIILLAIIMFRGYQSSRS